MVRVRDVGWAVAALALMLASSRPAAAGPLTMTGNVASDFNIPGTVIVPVGAGPGVNAGPSGSTANQLVGGFDIQTIRLNYNASNDTMYVGIQGYQNVAGKEEIFGDATGNPNPAADPDPNFGGNKSIAIAFAPETQNAAGKVVAGTPMIIAGIPANKSMGGSGTIDGFTVSQYSANSSGLFNSFGAQLSQNTGNLAFNPSAAQPDMEFTITNFSKIPGLNTANGFAIQAFAGQAGDDDGEVSDRPEPSARTPGTEYPGTDDLAGLGCAGRRGRPAIPPLPADAPLMFGPSNSLA